MSRKLRVCLLALALAVPQCAFSADKLIALTFDDGPRPYVLFGSEAARPGLLEVLDQQHVNATFFVMGWRLTPKTWGDRRYEKNIGVTCVDAVQRLIKRGHEIEDHTYSHVQLDIAERKKGEGWVIEDVEHGARLIEAVSGSRPVHCPKPSLVASVLRQIEQREKRGVYTHILTFHELSTTTAVLPELIQQLKARGYRFVTVKDYMDAVSGSTIMAQRSRSAAQLRRASTAEVSH